jgi:hypothetical protein
MFSPTNFTTPPFTAAVREALQTASSPAAAADLLFLEAWEMRRSADLGAILRFGQIRRANPELVAAVQSELKAL